mmetsp:Transcript_8620/g.23163  ORF Transcript_8620/g.23163 Transcript_8620/m.23163 type:complete len:211 (-) Transcript_8620:314-946(-)
MPLLEDGVEPSPRSRRGRERTGMGESAFTPSPSEGGRSRALLLLVDRGVSPPPPPARGGRGEPNDTFLFPPFPPSPLSPSASPPRGLRGGNSSSDMKEMGDVPVLSPPTLSLFSFFLISLLISCSVIRRASCMPSSFCRFSMASSLSFSNSFCSCFLLLSCSNFRASSASFLLFAMRTRVRRMSSSVCMHVSVRSAHADISMAAARSCSR